ncbi:hypothetical protein HPB48_014586 [Haemaphysalis longicornis]|uniref:Uncharacterized protein n=1 Tax=Haemaphysalis longicornis TaxID=44386 RepID=A0A9J6FR39_HAELO|nr:hypothetical protein HPB48_014586 [Haemaphysalis longicornis]
MCLFPFFRMDFILAADRTADLSSAERCVVISHTDETSARRWKCAYVPSVTSVTHPHHACTLKCKLCNLDHPMASRECRKKPRPPPPPLHVRERFSRTLPVYQHQSSALHRAPQQQVQAPTSRQHCTPHQLSWSSVAAPTAAPGEDFLMLPAQQASRQDNHPRIQKIEAENEQLKKQLDAQTARTDKLERRIEEL